MFPTAFDYHRAESVEDAVRLIATHPDAKLMAGGHSLIPMMKLRLAAPEAVIDIGRIADLRGIDDRGATIRVGALTTHDELAQSSVLQQHAPLVSEAASKIGDPAVRNKGTIGGNIAHADPASDLPAALLAQGATLHMVGPNGGRAVAAPDFFTGLLETVLRDDEVLTAIELDRLAVGGGACYAKFEHPASGYAICGAAATVTLDAGNVDTARLAFNGVAAVPFLAASVGGALAGGPIDDASIASAVDSHLTIDDPLGDVHASGEYRVQLARTFGKRALRQARDRALA